MDEKRENPALLVDRQRIDEWADLAKQTHDAWEAEWPEIRQTTEDRGLEVLCQPGCTACCFTRKGCTLSEAAEIVRHIEEHASPEQAEALRLRVESAASSLAKLREDGVCASADSFAGAGGVECPFLMQAHCAIYSVRPLECRVQWATTSTDMESCFRCPHACGLVEAETLGRRLANQLTEEEGRQGLPNLPHQEPAATIPEAVSYLWNHSVAPPQNLLSENAWQQRLQSRGTEFDQAWDDAGSDFRILSYQLTLPDEGDYAPDLTVVNLKSDQQKLYNREISAHGLPAMPVLYKRDAGCHFDWDQRKFSWGPDVESEMPYAVWMSDGLQERLMMWEAAKRCRGRVLCGGLGLGIFPQLALSLPRVESVHIVDVDPAIIELIETTWNRSPWLRRNDCTITASPIEDFLRTSDETFDTVYIDTWDAIYHEYLPHLNELTELSKRVLEPGGEILLWAFDMMVQQFLETAKGLISRRNAYLGADHTTIKNIRRDFPFLSQLVDHLRRNPSCSDDDLLTRAYELATSERATLGILKLTAAAGGGLELLRSQIISDAKRAAS